MFTFITDQTYIINLFPVQASHGVTRLGRWRSFMFVCLRLFPSLPLCGSKIQSLRVLGDHLCRVSNRLRSLEVGIESHGFEQESSGSVLEISDGRRSDIGRGQGRSRVQIGGDLRSLEDFSCQHREGGLRLHPQAARSQEPSREAKGVEFCNRKP